MAFPEKLDWDDKFTYQPSPLPEVNKFTASEANELRDSHNSIIDYLPIYLYSDENGYITAPSVLNDTKTLRDMNVSCILGIGPTVYFEYNAIKNPYIDGTTFSKDLPETTIMQANTHTPMQFTPNSMFTILKR